MPIAAHFTHTCEIRRPMISGADPYGGPGVETERVVYRGMCRLVEKSERVVTSAAAESYIATRYLLLLPARADVRERDHIAYVRERNGANMGTFTIGAVKHRRASALEHLSVELERVS